MNNQGNVDANKIDIDKWTLFDKIMYGGLGYGAFCFPTNFFKIIIAVIFPPLGEVVDIVGDYVSYELPFINWNVLIKLIQPESITRIVYSFLYTTFFYIPGLVYTLRNISDSDNPL